MVPTLVLAAVVFCALLSLAERRQGELHGGPGGTAAAAIMGARAARGGCSGGGSGGTAYGGRPRKKSMFEWGTLKKDGWFNDYCEASTCAAVSECFKNMNRKDYPSPKENKTIVVDFEKYDDILIDSGVQVETRGQKAPCWSLGGLSMSACMFFYHSKSKKCVCQDSKLFRRVGCYGGEIRWLPEEALPTPCDPKCADKTKEECCRQEPQAEECK
eukprot:TRINITY_DN38456_c0_g1_i1.p1 TRINITY_DN38456_c0_g1~~TRINITY_DN38456_c0_g1_i1.p1  ORF type:complete len:239 (-),score=34.96 TRINITY_DN38456_c0_g1_i1:213-857(-)